MAQYIDLGESRAVYDATGSGPPLLLIHGGEGSHRSFARLLPFLTDHFTVIRYDQRDCGETINPPSVVSLATLADDACDLLQALGHPSAHVFGTSFGGRVAQMLALRHPAAVDRLVLSSTFALPVSLADVHGETALALRRLRAGLPATAEELASYFFPATFLRQRPEFGQYFKAAAPRSEKTERRAATLSEVPDVDISPIKNPTLLIAGDADRVIPAELTLSMTRWLPQTRTTLMPGVGHLSFIQVPDVLAGHLHDFLITTESV